MKETMPQFVFVPTSVISVNYEFAIHRNILNILKSEEDYFISEILNDDFIWSAHLRSEYGITVEIVYLGLFRMDEVVYWINKVIHKTVKQKFDWDEYIKIQSERDHKEYLEKIQNETKEKYQRIEKFGENTTELEEEEGYINYIKNIENKIKE
jgi:hypothetical protein